MDTRKDTRMDTSSAITITFADVQENHVRMQKIGELAKNGYTFKELIKLKKEIKNCELVKLEKFLPKEYDRCYAGVLVIRNAVNLFTDVEKLWKEQIKVDYDKKALMYGRVVNKNCRHCSCFADFSQEPNYEKGEGRIINFTDVPKLNKIRNKLSKYFGEKSSKLIAGANYYHNLKECGIGFHGDSERKIVIAIRLGATIPLRFYWYFNNKRISKPIDIHLNHGDMYIMCEKATGYDWKKKSIPTLRHAAGAEKYIK